MQPEEMKSSWQAAKNSINTGCVQQPDPRRKTSLGRLADRYRRFAAIAFIVGSTSAPLLNNIGGAWLAVAYMMIMFALAVTDLSFYRAIKAIDLVTMSVDEVYRRTLALRRRHIISVVVAAPFVLGWIVWFGFKMDDPYMRWGIVSGAVVGFAMGLCVLGRFMSDYREVLDN